MFKVKLTIETLEQGVKYVQVNNKEPEWCQWCRFGVLFLTLTYFTPCSSVSTVNFESVNALGWRLLLGYPGQWVHYQIKI